MSETDKKLQNLLRMLECNSYEEAVGKVDKVKEAEKFLNKVEEMTSKVTRLKDSSFHTSW